MKMIALSAYQPAKRKIKKDRNIYYILLAYEGHLKVLQWARSQGCPWSEHTCTSAARGNRLKVLQWAKGQGCPWDKNTSRYGASGGHLEMLQWVRRQGCP